MGSCCHGPSGSNTAAKHGRSGKHNRAGWWGFGGFVLVLGLLWGFNGNPLVSQFAPAILLGMILLWLAVVAVRKLGLLHWNK